MPLTVKQYKSFCRVMKGWTSGTEKKRTKNQTKVGIRGDIYLMHITGKLAKITTIACVLFSPPDNHNVMFIINELELDFTIQYLSVNMKICKTKAAYCV